MKLLHLLLPALVLALCPLDHANAAPTRQTAAAERAVPACIFAWQKKMQQDAAEFFTDMMDAEADADWQEQYRAYKQETQQAINNAVQAATKLYQARCAYIQSALALRQADKKQLTQACKLVESLLRRDIACYMQVSMFSGWRSEAPKPTPRMPALLSALDQRPGEREADYIWRYNVQGELWSKMLDKVQEQIRQAYAPDDELYTSWTFEPISGYEWPRNDEGELTPEALSQKEKLGKLFQAAEEAWLHHVRAQSELICPAGCFHGTILPTLQGKLYLELLNSRDEYLSTLMGGIIQPEISGF